MKKKSNSLVIVYDYFSPAYKAGGPIQSLVNLADRLKEKYPVHVICSNRDVDGTILNVKTDEWLRINGTEVFYSTNGIGKGIKKLAGAQKFPIYINGLYSLKFNLLPALYPGFRKIVSVRGMLHPEALAQKRRKKQVYLFAWKLLGLHKRCEYHATSDQEKDYIRHAFGRGSKIWVIPNFPNMLVRSKLPPKQQGKLVLSTVALISKMKNHLIVLGALKNCNASIVYNIYGSIKDESYWQQCVSVIREMPENIIVNYHGSVPPAMIPEVLSKCHVVVQPSESENFGHSIFEALSAGRPVITSHGTPWNGLSEAEAGINAGVNQQELQHAISFFAGMDQSRMEQWSMRASEYARRSMDTGEIEEQYFQMFT